MRRHWLLLERSNAWFLQVKVSAHVSSLYKLFWKPSSQLRQLTINPLKFASSWYPGYRLRILQEILLASAVRQVLQPFIWENSIQSEHQPSHNLSFSGFLNLFSFQGCFSFCSRDRIRRASPLYESCITTHLWSPSTLYFCYYNFTDFARRNH